MSPLLPSTKKTAATTAAKKQQNPPKSEDKTEDEGNEESAEVAQGNEAEKKDEKEKVGFFLQILLDLLIN